jgi:hypothetical protein
VYAVAVPVAVLGIRPAQEILHPSLDAGKAVLQSVQLGAAHVRHPFRDAVHVQHRIGETGVPRVERVEPQLPDRYAVRRH